MSFEKLLQAGREMTPEAREESLRQLARDERFAALLGGLDALRNDFVAAATSQALAAHHGSLAHAAGSVFALDNVTDWMRRIIETAKD